MYIIIIGCGRTGSTLANMFSSENHDVVVVDEKRNSFSKLASDYTGITIEGNGIDEDVLRSAGIEKADALLALTDDDNSNIMASQIAKHFFEVDKVISKINNPHSEEIFEDTGIETINTIELSALGVRNILLEDSFQRFNVDQEDEIDIIVIQPEENMINKSLDKINFEAKILAIIRDGHIYQINEIEKIKLGDKLVISVEKMDYEQFTDFIKGEK